MRLEKISAGYRGVTKVHQVSLGFPKGNITVLIGPNGSGKSTLIKAACRLLPLMSGQIVLAGRDGKDYKRLEWARKVSYLAQTRNVPEISVQGIVLHGRFPYMGYPRRYRKEDVQAAEAAMDFVGIRDLADRNMGEISGGERQKAYVAMTIAQDCEFVFMDEPTTFLDIGHQLEIMRLATQLKEQGRSVVMVLHDLGMALTYADSLAVLDGGRLVAAGEPMEIYESGVLERVFRVKINRGWAGDRQVFGFERQ